VGEDILFDEDDEDGVAKEGNLGKYRWRGHVPGTT
jgi:hypothetical protein